MAECCVVLVNWNNAADTIRCLRSLRTLRSSKPEIIVVDNGSMDDSLIQIRKVSMYEDLPVTVLEAGENLGFGGGCNIGIRHALAHGADFVWLLNTDAVIHPDALSALVKTMKSDPHIGAVGSVIYDLERPARIQTWGGGQVHLRIGVTHHHHQSVAPKRLHYLTACSLLLRSEALAQVGLFDAETFFMYWEDADLCLRMREAGWRLAVAEESLIWHRISSSLGKVHPLKDYYITSSSCRFMRRYAPYPLTAIAIGMTARLTRRIITGKWTNCWAMFASLRGRPVAPPAVNKPPLLTGLSGKESVLRIAIESSTMLGAKAGIGRYAANMAQFLAQADGVEVRYFSANGASADAPRQGGLLSRQRMRWRQKIPMGRQARHLLAGIHLQRLCRQWLPDVIFGPNFIVPSADVPSVLVVHDLSHLRYPEMHPPGRVAFMERHLLPSLARASAVIVDSHFTEQEMLSRFPETSGRLRVIYPGIDARMTVDPTESINKAARAALSGDQRSYFLFLTTLEPRKNLIGLLAAYTALPIAVRRAHPLVLVGQMGWQEAPFAAQLHQLVQSGEVRTLGYVRDELLPSLYRQALALVYPSFYEGFGLPPVEAMAAGCPVLASNVTAMPEVCGDAALYCDPLDVDSIRDGMLRLAEDTALREELARRGPQRASLYSWEKAGAELLAVLQEATR